MVGRRIVQSLRSERTRSSASARTDFEAAGSRVKSEVEEKKTDRLTPHPSTAATTAEAWPKPRAVGKARRWGAGAPPGGDCRLLGGGVAPRWGSWCLGGRPGGGVRSFGARRFPPRSGLDRGRGVPSLKPVCKTRPCRSHL